MNLAQLELAPEHHLDDDAMAYLAGGADDLRTPRANRQGFAELALRPRRLVDLRDVDTTVELFGETLASPIVLAPVGFQDFFFPDGQLVSARAASWTRAAARLNASPKWPTTTTAGSPCSSTAESAAARTS